MSAKRLMSLGSKVYEFSHPTRGDYKKVPQSKIKNDDLRKYGFNFRKE